MGIKIASPDAVFCSRGANTNVGETIDVDGETGEFAGDAKLTYAKIFCAARVVATSGGPCIRAEPAVWIKMMQWATREAASAIRNPCKCRRLPIWAASRIFVNTAVMAAMVAVDFPVPLPCVGLLSPPVGVDCGRSIACTIIV